MRVIEDTKLQPMHDGFVDIKYYQSRLRVLIEGEELMVQRRISVAEYERYTPAMRDFIHTGLQRDLMDVIKGRLFDGKG